MYRKLYRLKGRVDRILEENLPIDMLFHSKFHTQRVFRSSQMYSRLEQISEEDEFILLSATLLHDIGFIKTYKNHEEIGCEIAEELLSELSFTEEQKIEIKKIIMSTRMPQKPKTILEKIICDSDLDHLGCSDFFIQGTLLRQEWETHQNKNFSDREWYLFQSDFLIQHKFFTNSATSNRSEIKEKNLSRIGTWLKVHDSSLNFRL